MVWIKICGITSRADARAVSGMGADSLGFIFSTGSPRRIGLGQAKEAVEGAGSAYRTGVFVNAETEMIIDYVKELGLDYVQLSGEEDISCISELKKTVPELKIIKALRIKDDDDTDYKKIGGGLLQYTDLVLVDSYDRDRYGGTGRTIDWQRIKGMVPPERLIVSGGLDHKNVSLALTILTPSGVDASSRLEARPGKKDLEKVSKFINTVRGFEKRVNHER